MQLGIFAKTFARPTLEETLDAVVAQGFRSIQFNLACAGLETVPARIGKTEAAAIRREIELRGLTMAALSGTINLIHPNPKIRREGWTRLQRLVETAPLLGTRIITLCTGTRDPDDMWRAHPQNESPEAWGDLVEGLELILTAAEEQGIDLGIEPEPGNVISTSCGARRLLGEMKSPRLRIVLDAANLVSKETIGRMAAILDEAIDLLGPAIGLAHAKELQKDGQAGGRPGTGLIDFSLVLDRLKKIKFDGAVIMHGVTEADVAQGASFLRRLL